MEFELLSAGRTTRFELPLGTFWLGGGESDDVRLPGLAPGLLKLQIEPGRATLTACEPIHVAGAPFPSRVPRLLAPTETVDLPEGIALRRTGGAPARPQTAMVLKKLLCELAEPEVTRSAALFCLTGLDMGRRFPLDFPRGVLGRGYQVAVRIRDRAVSRHHARLESDGAGYRLFNLGGMNGLYLNGKRLTKPTELTEGDLIELGHTLLRFEAAHGPGIPAPPPEPPESAPRPPPERSRGEWLLLGVGLSLAISGLLVGFALG